MDKFGIKLTDNDGKIWIFSNVVSIDIRLEENWCNICYYDSNNEYHEEVGDVPKSIEFIKDSEKVQTMEEKTKLVIEEEKSTNDPCEDCIWFECEVNGRICKFYDKDKRGES